MDYVKGLIDNYELEDFLSQETENEFLKQVIETYNNLNLATKDFKDYNFDIIYSEELNNILEIIHEAKFKKDDINTTDVNAIKQVIEKCSDYIEKCNEVGTIDEEVYMYTKQALEMISAEFTSKTKDIISNETVEKNDINLNGEVR